MLLWKPFLVYLAFHIQSGWLKQWKAIFSLLGDGEAQKQTINQCTSQGLLHGMDVATFSICLHGFYLIQEYEERK